MTHFNDVKPVGERGASAILRGILACLAFLVVLLCSNCSSAGLTNDEMTTKPDAPAPTIKQTFITLFSGAKDSSESFHLELLQGSELLWDRFVGQNEIWKNGRMSVDTANLTLGHEIPFNSIDEGRLIISKNPITSPSSSPLVEVVALLSNGNRNVILPRTSKPDSSNHETSTWTWSFRKDPFRTQESKDKDSEFGSGDTTYGLTIGASFDFLDKFKVDNVYSSVEVFVPKLWNVFGASVGLDAGLVQNRSTAVSKGSEEQDQYRINDTLAVTARYSNEITRKNDNLGFFLNPTVRLADGLYGFINVELRRRNITETPKYSKVATDTMHVTGLDNSFSRLPNSIFSNPIPKETVINELLLGPGATVKVEDPNISLEISTFFSSNLKGETSLVFQFDLLVLKSNLILGGEVRNRGLFRSDSTKEFIIYLAKLLSINALSDFFTSK
jgi:hypothetical protein